MSRMRLAARNWGLGASPIGTLWSLAYALVAAIVLLTTVVRTALAQEAAAEKPVDGKPAPLKIEPLRIGFAGRLHKIGYWTPLEVTLDRRRRQVAIGHARVYRRRCRRRSLRLPADSHATARRSRSAERDRQVRPGKPSARSMFAKIGQAGGERRSSDTPRVARPIERRSFRLAAIRSCPRHLMAARFGTAGCVGRFDGGNRHRAGVLAATSPAKKNGMSPRSIRPRTCPRGGSVTKGSPPS